jgi:hypothetical protein
MTSVKKTVPMTYTPHINHAVLLMCACSATGFPGVARFNSKGTGACVSTSVNQVEVVRLFNTRPFATGIDLDDINTGDLCL